MPPDVWNLLIQIPIVVAFIYYTQYMNKQFQGFLKEQREADRIIQKEMISKINQLKTSIDSHDEKVGAAISRMNERTRPRSEK
jgi:sensor histidine kinase regulating citrate/malate metabolism